MRYIILALMLVISSSYAHEMTPTYPKLTPSHIDGVSITTMQMFNKRKEIEYYEIAVFDSKWNPIPFVTSYNIIKISYLDHVTFDVYIRNKDLDIATYICSRSKLKSDNSTATLVSSKICSKLKKI